ncbi:MAG: hypothetical protein J6T51_05770 [Kiritimatiellae bacterium]|nr:hypothetical protein [Kiritimatiellia bacterium]
MSRGKIVIAAFAASFGMAFAAFAGDVYTRESTNAWFAVAAADADLDDTTVWTTPTNGEYGKSGGKIQLDTDVVDPLTYTPTNASGPAVIVNARFAVEPNVMEPDLVGLDDAQAALTVVTNAENEVLEWHGLTKVSGSLEWVPLYGNVPVSGQEYDVQILVDNAAGNEHGNKIMYAVKPAGAGETVVLTNENGVSWLDNPQDTNRVTSVSFAGSGAVGDFSGKSLLDDSASVVLNPEEAGFDFTNGTIKAVVTLPPNPSAHTAVLTVIDFEGGTTNTYEQSVTPGQTNVWDISGLKEGGTYSYKVQVKSGDAVCDVKSGTFTAANWSSDCWFAAFDDGNVTNGVFSGATFADGRWGIESNATFAVTDIAPGSNAVSRVDTKYLFESFIEAESLDRQPDAAVGGIVAVGDDGGAWYAYTGAISPESGWQPLTGGTAPMTNVQYVVRAEFDFLSSTHRVRYLVSSDDGASFCPLSLGNGGEWIDLTSQAAGSLSSVEMTGRGSVGSIRSKVAETAVAESGGVKYGTLWDALRFGNGTVTLLTNATLKPSDIPSGVFGPYTIDVGGYKYVFDTSSLTGNWRFVERNGRWYLIKKGSVYIFL